MDAVFNPNCLKDELVFQQEGWHYELDNKDAEMVYKGVVFNEMKGVYSQPDSIHQEAIQVRISTSFILPFAPVQPAYICCL